MVNFDNKTTKVSAAAVAVSSNLNGAKNISSYISLDQNEKNDTMLSNRNFNTLSTSNNNFSKTGLKYSTSYSSLTTVGGKYAILSRIGQGG